MFAEEITCALPSSPRAPGLGLQKAMLEKGSKRQLKKGSERQRVPVPMAVDSTGIVCVYRDGGAI